MFKTVIWLAIAGSLGTLARYSLSGIVQRVIETSFPMGTVTVNITGCFIAGFLWTIFENRWAVSGETKIAVMIGFMGAFTTFSTLILESQEMFRSAQWVLGFSYLAIQNVTGLIAMLTGVFLGQLI
ncbi:MAG: CrcB family protein [Synergistales bacterium]|nr:CrcB family protein [Synergistales bacterium]